MTGGAAGTVDVVVVAAGSSTRMAGIDKLQATLLGRPLLAWTLDAVRAATSTRALVLVTAPDRVEQMAILPWVTATAARVVAGGVRRQDSVAAGLAATDADVVLIHDGARPLVSPSLVDRVAAATLALGAAIPGWPVVETLKRVVDGRIIETVDRSGLVAAQTPQGGRRADLLAALAVVRADGGEATDEGALLESLGVPIAVVDGEADNLKVTTPADLERAEVVLAARLGPPRIGQGQDSHPFGPGDGLALGGIRIEGAPALYGHSDGDAALHAIADALLAATGRADLGHRFPAGDASTRGVDSRAIVSAVVGDLAQSGWRAIGVDLLIRGARPRLGATRLEACATRSPVCSGHRRRRWRCTRRPATWTDRTVPAGPSRHEPSCRSFDRDPALRNTLGGALEPFEPLDPSQRPHVQLRADGLRAVPRRQLPSFLFADLLRRYLAWRGYPVTWVMNITDVDDKIIRDAAAKGIPIGELTARYEAAFLDDLRRLRVMTPDVLPRATEHIEAMVALIETLLERGHAYRTEDGSIFFRIASWPAYGRLAHVDPASQRVGERVEADEYDKDDVRDFAVWKAAKPGEPSWPTRLGDGRPGWHIECSAMSMRYLGPSFDLHTGGIDLIFPHHEDEIAQSEAATGQPFVRTWLHCAHLQMSGEKMAKRTGNIARPADIYASGVPARALRFALIAAHYRASLDFSEASLAAAAAAVERLSTLLAALDAYVESRPDDPSLDALLEETRARSRPGSTTTSTWRPRWRRCSTSPGS